MLRDALTDARAVAAGDAHRRLAAGCRDPEASNHDAAASPHVQSACSYTVVGCMDSRATNYLSAAQQEQSPSDCTFPIHGCTVLDNTINYDSLATVLSTCVYRQVGQLGSTEPNQPQMSPDEPR